MEYKKIETNEGILRKLSSKCRFFYGIFRVLFIAGICVSLGILSFSILVLFIQDNQGIYRLSNWITIISIVVFASIIILIFKCLQDMFKDVANGESPFVSSQTRRMRIIALLLLIYALFDTFASFGFSATMMLNEFPVDYAILDDVEDPVISVNLGALIFALATYCFSVIFDYGIELQKQADEAL